jgi:hypothetical protein
MAFEPLQTDERIVGGAKPKSMDDLMIFGCTGFVLGSVLTYLLGVWPHLVFHEIQLLSALGLNLALALVPTAVFGAFVTVRYGLPGACGYVGGSMTTAVFLYLRLEALFLGAETKQIRDPEYGRELLYLVPIAWVVVAAGLAVGLLRLRRTSPEESPA